eukprot:gnl/MRDRNA2_/MRDRNA2_98769_c0_seq1.p1 gnl/MRDRNA2_/MRDRNA2_98769_c0~~gnl/MRDRNA2_/MRDRNA2_98769_c0_seq1.p1  ORF type:complete len:1929 (+),score=439.09 gnl/MRDRNA2_/MRDRNA2_98769_c0_seq1:73-5859(+)
MIFRLFKVFSTSACFVVLLLRSFQEADGAIFRAGARLGDQPSLGGQGLLQAARQSLKRLHRQPASHLAHMQIKSSVNLHKVATSSQVNDHKGSLSPYVPFWLAQNYTDRLEFNHKALMDKVAVWDLSNIQHVIKAGQKQKKVWDVAHMQQAEQKERNRLAHVECIQEEQRAQVRRREVCTAAQLENQRLEKEGEELKPVPPECETKVEGTPEELCASFGKDTPVPPRLGDVPMEQFKGELMTFKRQLTEMKDSFAELLERTAQEETELMTVRWNYDEFNRHFDKVQGGTDEARAFALAEIARRRNETEKMIRNRQACWDAESYWMWMRWNQLKHDAAFACGGPGKKCKDRKDKLLQESEFDYVDFLSQNLQRKDGPAKAGGLPDSESWNEYWSLPLLRLHLDALTFEELDVKSGERSGFSWWGGTSLPGWGWDQRRAHDLDFTHQLESIMQAGERYMDFRMSNLLLHIGKQKAQICEMEIMPALHIAGMIPMDTDVTPMREVQKEIMMLHQTMIAERQYLFEEQSRAFSMVPMIHSAIRDIDRPLSVLQECQKTSLKWWKCRKTGRQLHEYMADTVSFLEEQKLHLQEARDMIHASLPGDSEQRMTKYIGAIDAHMKTWSERNALYRKFKNDLKQAEKLVRGDSQNGNLPKFQATMLKILTTMLTQLEPKLHDIPAGSRYFQGNRSVEMLGLHDVLCDKTKYPFYGGGSPMASENRHAYYIMVSPDPWFLLGSKKPAGQTNSSIFVTIPTMDKEPVSALHSAHPHGAVVLPNMADMKQQRERNTRELIEQLRMEDWQKFGASATVFGTGESMKISQQSNEAWLPPNYTQTSDKGHEHLRQRFSHSSPSDESKAFEQGLKENERWTHEQPQLKSELNRRHKMYDQCVHFEQKKKDTKLNYFANCVKEEVKKRKVWAKTRDDCLSEEYGKRRMWKSDFKKCVAAEKKQRDVWKKEVEECVKEEEALRAEWKTGLEECIKSETEANATRVKVCEEYQKNISAPAPAPAPCPDPAPAPGPGPAPAPAPCPPPTTTTPPPPPLDCSPTEEQQSGPEAICLARERENLTQICSNAEAEVTKAGEDEADVKFVVNLACKENATSGTLFPTEHVCQERQNITNARVCLNAEEKTSKLESEGKRPDVNLVVHKSCTPFESPELPCGARQNITWVRACDDSKREVDSLRIAGEPVPKTLIHFSECYAHDYVFRLCDNREALNNSVMCNDTKDIVAARQQVWAPISLDLAIYSECYDEEPPEHACELRAILNNNRTCNASLNDTRDKFAAGDYGEIKPNVSECQKSLPPAHHPEDPPEVICHQPRVPTKWINVSFDTELKEMRKLVQSLEDDLWEVKWRHEVEAEQVQDARAKFEAFQQKLDQAPDFATAKKENLDELARRRTEAQDMIKKRTVSFELEKAWITFRTDVLKKSIPKHCNETSCTDLPWSRTQKDILVREAEQDELVYMDRALKRTDSEDQMNEPWSIRLLHEQLDAIADEEQDLQSDEFKDSFWKGNQMPGWSWDERNDNYMAAADTMENVLEASERYFKYLHATVLTHLNQRKAQLCELQLQPAMLIAGMIIDVPDMTYVDLIQSEAKLLHEAMMVERSYHWEEQSRVWSMMPLLHAALRDLKRPDEVLKECHMTSLSWYKCRKSSLHLLDYIDDMATHLDQDATEYRKLSVSIEPKKDMPERLQEELDHYKPMVAQIEKHIKSSFTRLELYRKRGTQLMEAEALARGDGNGTALGLLKERMSVLLEEFIADMQPLLQEIPQASFKFQESMGMHLLDLMDRKCKYVKEFFYKGNGINATQNREAYAVLSGEEVDGEASLWWDEKSHYDGQPQDKEYWYGNMTDISQQTGIKEWLRKDDHDIGYPVIDTEALAKSCNHTTILGCVKAKLLQRTSIVSKGFLQKPASIDPFEKAKQQRTAEIVRLLHEAF